MLRAVHGLLQPPTHAHAQVVNLESKTAQISAAMNQCKKNLDAIPRIVDLLKMTGALQDDA